MIRRAALQPVDDGRMFDIIAKRFCSFLTGCAIAAAAIGYVVSSALWFGVGLVLVGLALALGIVR